MLLIFVHVYDLVQYGYVNLNHEHELELNVYAQDLYVYESLMLQLLCQM